MKFRGFSSSDNHIYIHNAAFSCCSNHGTLFVLYSVFDDFLMYLITNKIDICMGKARHAYVYAELFNDIHYFKCVQNI